MSTRPRACLIFFGDLNCDSRALRFIDALLDDYDVHVIITTSKDEKEQSNRYTRYQISTRKNSGFKFSLSQFYYRAIPIAKKINADIYIASDLYSLPVAWNGAKANKAKLIYDSRELYSSIAALHERKFTQGFWTIIENRFAQHAQVITTVNKSIADILQKKFPTKRIEIIHNYPIVRNVRKSDLLRTQLNIPANLKILLSQGGLQKGRGAFILLKVLKSLPDCALVFLGSGKLKEEISLYAHQYNLEDRVFILDAVPSDVLLDYTASADIGLCMIENLGMSYYLSLPNKLFEYIAAGVPVVGSNFPEIKKVIEKNELGITINPENNVGIISSIRKLLDDQKYYDQCGVNCNRVKYNFDWKNERTRLQKVLN